MKNVRKTTAVAAALMVAAMNFAPQASAHGLRDVLRRIANEASVRQNGSNDRAATAQSGGANGSLIEQNGDSLTASVRQNGDANNAAIRQFGRNNTGSITQNGSGNDACLIQFGRSVNAEIVQNGDGGRTGVLQTPRASMPIPVEMCQTDRHHAAGLIASAVRLSILGSRR